jgi:hypothetical protein
MASALAYWGMPEVSKKNKKAAAPGATASGIIEAMEQDVELTFEQVKDAASGAMAAVEKKLRGGNPRTATKPKSKSIKKGIGRKKK